MHLTAIVALTGLLATAPEPRAIDRARELEASLKKDAKKLRYRTTTESLIRAWEAAVKQSTGADRTAAREGEARAWKLLAHWSGRAEDAASAKEAERRAREKSEPSRAEAREEEKAGRPYWLAALTAEVVGERLEVVVPVKGDVKVRTERIGPKDGHGSRMVFDLSPVIAAREALKPLVLDHAGLARVRVGQSGPSTVRLVFDAEKGKALPEPITFVPGDPSKIVAGAEPQVAEVRAAEPESAQAPAADPLPEPDDPLSEILRVRLAAKAAAEAAPEAPDPAPEEVPAPPPTPWVPPTAAESPPALAEVEDASDDAPQKLAPPPATSARGLVKIRRVVIDAGHGGKDTGAIGRRGTREKDVTLAIAMRVGKQLEKKLGVEVVYTRARDEFVSLAKRATIANKSNADLFLSIHANAHKNPKIEGVETYFLNTTSSRYATRLARRENAESFEGLDAEAPEPDGGVEEDEGALPLGSLGRDLRLLLADLAMRSATEESRRLAGYVQAATVTRLRQLRPQVKDLGVKHALFFVLLGSRMPSILLESGFVTSAEEEQRLATPAYQAKLAAAVTEGVQRFVEERNSVAQR